MTQTETGAGSRPGARLPARAPKLSREAIVLAALAFLDREGSDALTINALATQLGTKGPSLYNHVDSLEDLRRAIRMRVIDDILQMLTTVGAGRTRDDAVMAMASAYRSYAHHHPGRYSAFTRMPSGGDDPDFAVASRAAAAPAAAAVAMAISHCFWPGTRTFSRSRGGPSKIFPAFPAFFFQLFLFRV